MPKTALITGITGQDGAYLADFLLKKDYIVHGIKRRSSLFNTQRIDHIFQDPHVPNARFFLHYGDMNDLSSVLRVMQETRPDEVYNLAAQSHVQISFELPEYTAQTDAIGPLRLLDAIRILRLEKKTRFYQAATSELFGKVAVTPQDENTPFYPRSPYAAAKLYAYWITVNYREAYGMFAVNGILFNHESPLRGETFVTRKITRAAARIKLGLQDCLYLGHLDAKRDWGHAKEYVEGMWRMLQADEPEDFVLATGRTVTVREFLQLAFSILDIKLEFNGTGIDEIAKCVRTGKTLVRIDPEYYRRTEVDVLCGNAQKAKEKLGWEARISMEELCREMVVADLITAQKEKIQSSEKNLPNIEQVVHTHSNFLPWYQNYVFQTNESSIFSE